MDRIVITGGAGTIGRLLTAELEPDYDVRALDRKWRSGPLQRREDTRQVRSVEKAFAGAHTVIDLAGDSNELASWEAVRKLNIPSVVGAFEAARRGGARRVIYASSGHVMGMYERDEPYASISAGRYATVDRSQIPMITSSFPIRPDGPYAVGKALGEAAGRFYADEFGLSVICLRIGVIYPENRPKHARDYPIMLSHGDLNRLVRACITAPPTVKYAILYGISLNTWRFWDIGEGRDLVGYEPVDDAGEWGSPTRSARPLSPFGRAPHRGGSG